MNGLGVMPITCAGYPTDKTDDLQVALRTCTRLGADQYADYFEICRSKRNDIDYKRCHVARNFEAREIMEKPTELKR